jgi:hypothetical protein
MPLIMQNGRLVQVASLKSDKKSPIAAPSNVKPETIEEEVIAQNTEAAASEVNTEVPSIHESKTIKELKAFLEANKIEFPKSAKKPLLIELADSVEDSESEV